MNSKLNWIVGVSFFLIICVGCEQSFLDEDKADDPIENFDFLWNTMNQRYSLFEDKGIDWDSIYTVYRPRVTEDIPYDELFNTMAEMLNTLRDGHTNLWSPIDISRYYPYLNSPANFDYDLLERNYLRGSRLTGYLENTILDDVGYVRYRSFTLPINNWELDTVINYFERNEVKGVVIDIRHNGGGDPANGLKLLARLIDERTHIYTSQQKNGPDPDDFDIPKPIFQDPEDEHPHFPGKVVVLCNRTVYSAGSYFSAGIKAIPDIPLIGDTSGGGSGVPAGFELPNGWHCNYSSTIGTLVTGENFESGVPVDIQITLTDEDRQKGIDTILERGLAEIRNN